MKTRTLAALLPLLTLLLSLPGSAKETKPTVVRWVLAHTRADEAYKPMFDEFARRLSERSHGGLKVEYVGEAAGDDNGNAAAHAMVLSGKADLGQFEREFADSIPAVTAPFAFRSYSHAEAVFNGPLGKRLLDNLYASSDRKLRALAFTYSGGERVFFGTKPIAKLSDLKGQTVETPGNSGWSPVRDEVLKAVGAKLAAAKDGATGDADQREDAINRGPLELKKHPEAAKGLKYVNITNHSLLVTAVVANERFLASLPADKRKLLVEEIEALALKERRFSIDLQPKRLKELAAAGLSPVELPAAERARFIDASDAVLKTHAALWKQVQEIRAVHDDAAVTGL